MSLKRVFVFEYLSGGGLDHAAGDRAEPPVADGRGDERTLLAQGLAMRDAIVADLAAVDGLELHYACAPGVPAVAGGHGRALAARAGESPFDMVRREAVAHDLAWVVAPESDGLLEALARCVGPRRWVGCSLDAIRLAGRKRATLDRLAVCGIATPLALAFEAHRWVVKPDDGAGALDTRVHERHGAAEADFAARRARGIAATLEPWVDGEPLSLSLLCRRERAELLAVNRQRIEVAPDGVLDYHGVRIAALPLDGERGRRLAALAADVHHAVPGLRGYVGIDLVWHPQRGPVVIEINPRVTCAYVGLSAVLGRALGGEILALHRSPS